MKKQMNKIFEYIKNIWGNKQNVVPYIIIVLCVILLLLNNCQPQKEKVIEKIKVEYVIKHDTITIEKPIPITKYVYKTITDTILVNNVPTIADIPIERKIYQDNNYRAVVSGYKPNLDTLSIYRKDSLIYTTIEREITKYRNDYSRWSLGISGGYAITDKGLSPYIGIGINYDLIRWRKRR